MHMFSFAAGLLAAGLCAPTFAQAANEPIKYFTAENVQAALTGLGAASVTSEKDKTGSLVVRFSVREAPFLAVLTGCKGQPGCLGLLLVIPVGLPDGKFSHQAVNGFNEVLPFGKAVRGDDGAVVFLSRYLISDGGISEENLRANIGVFTAMPDSFAKYLSAQLTASLSEPAPHAVPIAHLEASGAPHSEIEQRIEMLVKEPRYVLPR